MNYECINRLALPNEGHFGHIRAFLRSGFWLLMLARQSFISQKMTNAKKTYNRLRYFILQDKNTVQNIYSTIYFRYLTHRINFLGEGLCSISTRQGLHIASASLEAPEFSWKALMQPLYSLDLEQSDLFICFCLWRIRSRWKPTVTVFANMDEDFCEKRCIFDKNISF